MIYQEHMHVFCLFYANRTSCSYLLHNLKYRVVVKCERLHYVPENTTSILLYYIQFTCIGKQTEVLLFHSQPFCDFLLPSTLQSIQIVVILKSLLWSRGCYVIPQSTPNIEHECHYSTDVDALGFFQQLTYFFYPKPAVENKHGFVTMLKLWYVGTKFLKA